MKGLHELNLLNWEWMNISPERCTSRPLPEDLEYHAYTIFGRASENTEKGSFGGLYLLPMMCLWLNLVRLFQSVRLR
jgi:hypothetical protein